jgi:hypothetical protein
VLDCQGFADFVGEPLRPPAGGRPWRRRPAPRSWR